MGKPTDIVIVVDDENNVLRYVTHAEVKPTERWRDTAVFIFNTSNNVLLAQRHKNKRVLPNIWGPAASGTVEKHETYEQNALKELQEEIGLTKIPLQHIGDFKMDYDTHKRFTGLFVGVWDGDIKKLQLEENQVQAVKWLNEADFTTSAETEPERFIPKILELYNLVKLYITTSH